MFPSSALEACAHRREHKVGQLHFLALLLGSDPRLDGSLSGSDQELKRSGAIKGTGTVEKKGDRRGLSPFLGCGHGHLVLKYANSVEPSCAVIVTLKQSPACFAVCQL